MTTAVAGRVRRSMRYAEFDLRNPGRQQHADVRRERMRCADSFQEFRFQNTQDWTNTMDISPSGRFQVIEDPKPKVPLISREGLRWEAASAVLILLAVIFGIVLTVNFGLIGMTDKQIRNLDSKVTAVTSKNDILENELRRESQDISVCTEALKLNLISAYGAQTTYLTVPSGASFVVDQPSAETEPQETKSGRIASAGR